MAVWTGSRKQPVNLAEVEDWVKTASVSYGRAKVVFDPYQAAHLTQRLASAGVPTEQFTFSSGSVGKLAMTLHRLLRDRALVLPDDSALIEELAHVRLRETSPGVVRLDHDAGRHDDRAVAIALTAHELLAHPTPVAVASSYNMTALRGTR